MHYICILMAEINCEADNLALIPNKETKRNERPIRRPGTDDEVGYVHVYIQYITK